MCAASAVQVTDSPGSSDVSEQVTEMPIHQMLVPPIGSQVLVLIQDHLDLLPPTQAAIPRQYIDLLAQTDLAHQGIGFFTVHRETV